MGLLPDACTLRTQVIGPAYLDEIVEVEGALCDPEWVGEALPAPAGEVRLDYSRTEASRQRLSEPGVFLQVESRHGDRIRVTDPGASRGRRLLVEEERLFDPGSLGLSAGRGVPPLRTEVRLRDTRLQLGGMGAGYALALGGRLVLPLGGRQEGPDEEARRMCRMLEDHGIDHASVLVPGASTDLTTLLWSSAGDKLPVGRRSACSAVSPGALLERAVAADLDVITSLPNSVARDVAQVTTGWTLYTPSMRNVSEGGIEGVAAVADAMSMNSTEWGGLADPREVRASCSPVLVTHGEGGVAVSFRGEDRRLRWVRVPAAPVERVVDANHAGEACAAAFVGALLDLAGLDGLRAGLFEKDAVREAAWQGALAAALELRFRAFAFPTRADVLRRRAALGTPRED